MKRPLAVACSVAIAASLSAEQSTPSDRLLARRYAEGERLEYVMNAVNDGAAYSARITATTKKREDGRFVEEFAWERIDRAGKPQPMPPAAQAFRLTVTLAGGAPFEMPDLSKATGIVGPVLDLLTFYADLFLAMQREDLRQPGDLAYVSNLPPSSWADGVNVLVGEDHVDFDITLTDVDRARGEATLRVKHVPPKAPAIKLPAAWMSAAVTDTPNNFVQVRRVPTGFRASVGKETFDVTLRVSVPDGKILTASMHNPVTKITRDCRNVELTDCDAAKDDPTLRTIEMALVQ